LIKKEAYRNFDYVVFANGYNKKRPKVTIEFKGIGIASGMVDCGAIPEKKYYVIKLGNIISCENC
jgi:hypothetical protein